MEISGYRIRRTIGQGGMGTVYLATQESLDRDVCLKTMNASRAESNEYFERFLNEGRIVAGLRHPHIITIYDIGAAGDVVYIAMEYVEGGDLKDRLLGALPPGEALELLVKIGSALDFAHQRGIIHRDVKPANILYRSESEPLLSDFGIAKQVQLDTELTSTGTILGSPFYMSPEQSEGLQVDGRADLYSLGIIFYEALTGTRPYQGETPIKIIMEHLQKPVPRLPPELARFQPLLEGMIAKNRRERFPDAGAMVDYVLTEHGRELEPTTPLVAPGRLAPRSPARGTRKRRMLAVALGGGLLVGILFGGIYLYARSIQSPAIVAGPGPATPPALSALPETGGAVPQAGTGPRPAPPEGKTAATGAQAASGQGGTDSPVMVENVKRALKFLGEKSLAEDRLSTPPADNALYYFSRLLAMDPDNPDARRGLQAIAERYVQLAERAFAAGDDVQAEVYIALGLQVDPGNQDLLTLRSLVRERKRTPWDAFLDLFRSREARS